MSTLEALILSPLSLTVKTFDTTNPRANFDRVKKGLGEKLHVVR